MKSVAIVGNRDTVAKELHQFKDLKLEHILAIQHSPLWKFGQNAAVNTQALSVEERNQFYTDFQNLNVDIVISHGCPFIIPSKILQSLDSTICLNVHPAKLPRHKGQHPINGVLLDGDSTGGVTLHYLSGEVDGGAILHQETFPITQDLDSGLVYQIAFQLEPVVFVRGMKKLIESNFDFVGLPMQGEESFYSRRKIDRTLDLKKDSSQEICRRVRAFGVPTQGCWATLGNRTMTIFEAIPVRNSFLTEKYRAQEVGTLALAYEDKLLVKTSDGLLLIKRFKWN